jgi:hypothetical protein
MLSGVSGQGPMANSVNTVMNLRVLKIAGISDYVSDYHFLKKEVC